MINLSCIYQNPVLPHGFYWAKCLDVDVKREGDQLATLWALLRIHPQYEPPAGATQLKAIVHNTPKASYLLTNFYMTFRTSKGWYDAVGRWGSVEVIPAEYKGTHYGLVRFCYQPFSIVHHTLAIEKADENGEIQWPEGD
jgi:hypothetical protein